MVKLRNAKPKKINDFKKIQTKVGKKISRGPTTIINVKAKRIILPTQLNVSIEPIVEENAKISQLMRQFHHHSLSHRISALEDMNQLLSTSNTPEMHVALVLPSVLELLFDEDKELRQNLLKLVKNLLERCPQKETYETIAPVITTYACSGLTSLIKGIRLDSLHLLNMFLSQEKIRQIFQPDVDKLLTQVHYVLAAPSQINTAVTFNVAPKTASATSIAKKTPKDQKKENVPSLFTTSYILTSIQVLSNLLLLLESSLNIKSYDPPKGTYRNHQVVDQSIDIVLLQNPYRREIFFGSRFSDALLQSQSSRLKLLSSIESTVCSYWNLSVCSNLISTSASSETYQIITSLASLSFPLSAILFHYLNSTSLSSNEHTLIYSHHLHLFQQLFKFFPYQSEEGAIAPSGSTLESESKKRIDALNMILCESSFKSYLRLFNAQNDTSYFSDDSTEMSQMITLSSSYLSGSLETFSQKLARQINYFTENSNRQRNYQKINFSSLETDDHHDNENDLLVQQQRNSTLSESLLRLFRCLLYHSNYMISQRNHSNHEMSYQLTLRINQFSSLLDQLLLLLSHLQHFHSHKSSNKTSKETLQILYSIENILNCTTGMMEQDNVWDFKNFSEIIDIESRNQSLLILLEKICQIPSILCSLLSSSGLCTTEISHSILQQVPHILRVIITRGGIDNQLDQSTNHWKQKLNQLICQTINEIFDTHDDDQPHPNKKQKQTSNPPHHHHQIMTLYLQCQPSYRLNWFDIWFYCNFENSMERNQLLMNILDQLFSVHEIDEEEQIYFFSLLYLKRFDYQPNDFIMILLSTFDIYTTSTSMEEEDRTALNTTATGNTSTSSLTFLSLFMKWSKFVSNILYFCSSSSSTFSMIHLLLPYVKEFPRFSATLTTSGRVDENQPRTFFYSYLISNLFVSLLRSYECSTSSSSSSSLIPPVITHHDSTDTSSTTPTTSTPHHSEYFSDFLTLLIDSLSDYLIDNTPFNQLILQSSWNSLKENSMNYDSRGGGGMTHGNSIPSHQWLLDILQTLWKYKDVHDQVVVVNIWELLLEKLGTILTEWSKEIPLENNTNGDINPILIITQRCVYLFQNIFEILQYFKISQNLTIQRSSKMLDFLSFIRNTLPIRNIREVEEYIDDLVKYLD